MLACVIQIRHPAHLPLGKSTRKHLPADTTRVRSRPPRRPEITSGTPLLLDQIALRAELADHYDLAPSTDIALANADIFARMDRVVTPPDWAIYAPYVAAINKLKK